MKKVDPSSSTVFLGNTIPKKQISPAKHWCFTLNNYTDSDINEISSNIHISKYIFQEEKGQNGTPHLQGYIEFMSKIRPKEMFNDKIHWEKTKDIKASIKYCQKEDTRVGKIYTKDIKIEENLKLLNLSELYEWQSDIVSKCLEEPDDRTINVIVDIKGNKGKTKLCKLLCARYEAICVSGKSADIKYAIVKYKEDKGVYPKIVLIDVPRCNKDYINYEAIEKVKDGLFFCGKYESCQVIMNCPHLFVFTNEYPDVSKMSVDRWNIIDLDENEDKICLI